MGYARTWGAVVVGVEGHLVEVEAHIGGGLPEFRLVGLPDTAVRESRDRVRSALKQLGVSVPPGRITVNLAPARLRKAGSSLDLPIACAVLGAAGTIPGPVLSRCVLIGELSLDGKLRSVDGLVALLVAARRPGLTVVVPEAARPVAERIAGVPLEAAPSLAEVVRGLRSNSVPSAAPRAATGQGEPYVFPEPQTSLSAAVPGGEDMAEVRGQALARRAAEIAAAGWHHLMLVGPPGSGKTMLARRLVGILPPLTRQEWLEVLQIDSAAAGRLSEQGREVVEWHPWLGRPFRAPHHTCTVAGLIGGGPRLSPGELTLAHRGVLFLDEFAELAREVADALREPMEEGWVTLVRGSAAIRLPAEALVVGAANPCPCGRFGSRWPGAGCQCDAGELRRYRRRLQGPLSDRFDLWLRMKPVAEMELLTARPAESSPVIRGRVIEARQRQLRRFLGDGWRPVPFGRSPVNGRMTSDEVRRFCRLDGQLESKMMEMA
ncbi:MAG: YifB family Mg chelatase-like AAA ATPase, partial [Bacillota bacterium]